MASTSHISGWQSTFRAFVLDSFANQSFLLDLVELIDFYPLVLYSLVHPIAAFNSNLSAINIFGGVRFDPDTDVPRLSNKVILVTGGNTGLGRETVRQLAKHEPSHIYLAARTPSKGEAAAAAVKQALPHANITFLPLDLASFDSISSAARLFKRQSQRLDVLINNAGVMALPPGTTSEGYEIQLGTNHVGHALLTRLLLPTMLSTAKEKNSDVRIIHLTSEAHQLAPRSSGLRLNKAQLDQESTWVRYGHSKLANIMYARELAERYPSITSVAVHPGIIKTDLYGPNQRSSTIMKYGLMIFGSLMKTIETGVHNQLWAATTEKENLVNGAYYTPVGCRSNGGGYAQNQKLSKELWDWTEKELDSKGY